MAINLKEYITTVPDNLYLSITIDQMWIQEVKEQVFEKAFTCENMKKAKKY